MNHPKKLKNHEKAKKNFVRGSKEKNWFSIGFMDNAVRTYKFIFKIKLSKPIDKYV